MAIGAALGIREGEGKVVALLTLHALLLGVANVFLESAASALFLSKYDSSLLPQAYIVAAITVTVVGRVHAGFEARVRFSTLMLGTVAVLGASMAAFRLGLGWSSARWPIFALFVWVEVTSVLAGLELWSVCGQLMTVRQGKRLFGVIGAGEVLAGIAGGLVVPLVVQRIGAPNLLWISTAGFVAALAVLWGITRAFADDLGGDGDEDEDAEPATWKTQLADRYLLLMFAVAALSAMAFYFVDLAFYQAVEARYPSEDKLAAFFGTFFAATGAVQLVVQLGLSGRLLSRFGLSLGLLALPVALGLVMVATVSAGTMGLSAAIFWLVLAAKVADTVVRSCIEEPSVLTLYQPLRANLRLRAQATVESLVEPIAGGLTGLVLWLGAAQLSTAPRIAVVLIGVVLAWSVAAFVMRRRYTTRLARALERGRVAGLLRSRHGWVLGLGDAASSELIQQTLQSDNPGVVLYALDLMEETEHPDLERSLCDALSHPSPQVKLGALERCARLGLRSAVPIARELRDGDDAELRAAAIRALCALGDEDDLGDAAGRFEAADPRERSSALAGCCRSAIAAVAGPARERLCELCVASDALERRTACHAIAYLGPDDFAVRQLLILLRDPRADVCREALRAAGSICHPRLWPAVIEHLWTLRLRSAAHRALLAGGESTLGALEAAFGFSVQAPELQERIVGLMGRIGTSRAKRWLVAELAYPNESVRHAILQALVAAGYRARGDAAKRLEEAIAGDLEDATWTLAAMEDLADPEAAHHAEPGLLVSALGAELDANTDRVLLALSLLYRPQVMARVRTNLGSDDGDKRAYALELLDNVLSSSLRRQVMPLLDDLPAPERLGQLESFWPQTRASREERLVEIVTRPQQSIRSWTRACGLYTVGALRVQSCLPAVALALAAPSPVARETAIWALHQLRPTDLGPRLRRMARDPAPQVARMARHLQLAERAPTTLVDSTRFGHGSGAARAGRDELLRRLQDAWREAGELARAWIACRGGGEACARLLPVIEAEIHRRRRVAAAALDALYPGRSDLGFWFGHPRAELPERQLQRLDDVLDSVLPQKRRGKVRALLVTHDGEKLAAELEIDKPGDWPAAVARVAFDVELSRPWTRASALHVIGRERLPDHDDPLQAATADPSAMVRETAAWALSRIAPDRFTRLASTLREDSHPLVRRLADHSS